ncbi:MAG: ApaG domain [Verrucomicrobia bacterium]|nr:ApaG domain [Verrucomicrobiota bacterium]
MSSPDEKLPSLAAPSRQALCELPGLAVRVDRVIFQPQLDAPLDRPYPFVYFLTIRNDSADAVQILGRKWIVTDLCDGHRVVVEGEGVVGQRPQLAPGEEFSYHSYHPVAGRSQAEGAFFGRSASGALIFVRIPPFVMQLPTGEVTL